MLATAMVGGPAGRKRAAALVLAGLAVTLAPARAAADEASFEDQPAGESVEDLDSPLARAVAERIRARTLFPRLKRRLQRFPPFVADTELLFEFRTFYYPLLELDGTRADAWAAGGKLRYRSGWLEETAQIGLGLYTSQKLSADDELGLTGLLQPGEKSYTVLGEAFLRLRHREIEATLYRQELSLPYVNKQDSRMTPNTFQGVVARGTAHGVPNLGRIHWVAGYLSDIRPRDGDRFISMSEQAGARGTNRGMLLAGIQLQPTENLHLGAYEYFVSDTLNIAYLAADWTRKLSDAWSLRLQGQFTHQSSAGGDDLTGDSFATWVLGGRTAVSYRSATLWLAFSHTDDDESIRSPWGTYAGYLSLMQRDFKQAGETAWLVGASYDFRRVGLEGLSTFVQFAAGNGGRDAITGISEADRWELDLTLDYRIDEGTFRGFWFRVRGSLLDRDGSERTARELRVILNYEIPIL